MLSIECPVTLNELKHQALCIDNQYWEHQGKKQTTTSIQVPSSSSPSTTPHSNVHSNTPIASKPSEQKDLSGILDATGHLTEGEKEQQKSKGLCPYCSELPTWHAKGCHYQEPATGRAIFILNPNCYYQRTL